MKTDAQLRCDVVAALSSSPKVVAARIGVDVREGVVTLLGTPRDHAEQRAAELAAGAVAGLRTLISELKVVSPWGLRCDDANLGRAVEHALRWVSSLPMVALRVRVDAGWITLTGEVVWDYQRQAATAIVRRLTGVAGVNNHVTLVPTRARGSRPMV